MACFRLYGKEFSAGRLLFGRVVGQIRRLSDSKQFEVHNAKASSNKGKVALLGASGGIGQPLSLLLKQSRLIARLNLFDIVNVQGIAADLSHIETKAKVSAFQGLENVESCLKDIDVVVIAAGVPRKPGMTRADLFNTNAGIVYSLADAAAQYAPNATLCLIANPINSTVPIVSEVYKHRGVYDPLKIFGITTLDIIRANTFIAEAKGLPIISVNTPVVGGHSGVTIVPLISQCSPPVSFPPKEREAITNRIRQAGTEIVNAKKGKGSATLSMSYAAARFIQHLIRALQGSPSNVECAYVKSDVCGADVPYFSTPLLLGTNGIEKNLGLGKLNQYEHRLVEDALPVLKQEIEKGLQFVSEKIKN